MMIPTNQLNEQQLNELKLLELQCKKADGSTPNVYSHILCQPRTLPAIRLYYEKGELVGFLSVYFFYDDAVEIALLIAPSVRKNGVAKNLLRSILPLISEQNFEKLIFSSPSLLNNQWLPKRGFTYLHSEYYMERHDLSPLLDYVQTLSFRTATMNDIPLLCAIDKVCFPIHHVESVERFQHLIEGRDYQIIIALNNNEVVGKAHIRWQENGATLSDIAILPVHQGKGWGTGLIAHCINYALSEGKPHLNLDVETHNLRALDLYSRLGFSTQNSCDYWSIQLHQLIE